MTKTVHTVRNKRYCPTLPYPITIDFEKTKNDISLSRACVLELFTLDSWQGRLAERAEERVLVWCVATNANFTPLKMNKEYLKYFLQFI